MIDVPHHLSHQFDVHAGWAWCRVCSGKTRDPAKHVERNCDYRAAVKAVKAEIEGARARGLQRLNSFAPLVLAAGIPTELVACSVMKGAKVLVHRTRYAPGWAKNLVVSEGPAEWRYFLLLTVFRDPELRRILDAMNRLTPGSIREQVQAWARELIRRRDTPAEARNAQINKEYA